MNDSLSEKNLSCGKHTTSSIFKGTVMQIEKALINDRFLVSKLF